MKNTLHIEKEGFERLKLISPEALIIEPVSGEEIIPTAGDLFSLDEEFNWVFEKNGALELGRPSKKTKVRIYETQIMMKFIEIFKSFDENIERLCLTQHQILYFIRKYSTWIKSGRSTLFLFKSESKLFVAIVWATFNQSVLHLNLCSVVSEYIWCEFSNVVIPEI